MIPNDPLWTEALTEIAHLPALAQCYRLGELAGWQCVKTEDTGCMGTTELYRLIDAYRRVKRIARVEGDTAFARFNDGLGAVAHGCTVKGGAR